MSTPRTPAPRGPSQQSSVSLCIRQSLMTPNSRRKGRFLAPPARPSRTCQDPADRTAAPSTLQRKRGDPSWLVWAAVQVATSPGPGPGQRHCRGLPRCAIHQPAVHVTTWGTHFTARRCGLAWPMREGVRVPVHAGLCHTWPTRSPLEEDHRYCSEEGAWCVTPNFPIPRRSDSPALPSGRSE